MEDRTTMQNRTISGKSKLYCSRCGSFDLTKRKRSFFARHVLKEPKKLHCQSCDAALSFQQISANTALSQPSFFSESDDTVLSRDSSGRPIYVTMNEYVTSPDGAISSKKQYQHLMTGLVSGIALFGLVAILFMVSPHSKTLTKNKDIYVQPITRLGDVELLRLDNTRNKNSGIEVVLLDEPKKSPDELAWEDVAEQVGRIAKKNEPAATQPILTIQRDLDRLLSN